MCFRVSSKLDTTVKTGMQIYLEKGTSRNKLHCKGVLCRRQAYVHVWITQETFRSSEKISRTSSGFLYCGMSGI